LVNDNISFTKVVNREKEKEDVFKNRLLVEGVSKLT
jgi:hypothetical protein